jgi:hypothetical protein
MKLKGKQTESRGSSFFSISRGKRKTPGRPRAAEKLEILSADWFIRPRN